MRGPIRTERAVQLKVGGDPAQVQLIGAFRVWVYLGTIDLFRSDESCGVGSCARGSDVIDHIRSNIEQTEEKKRS